MARGLVAVILLAVFATVSVSAAFCSFSASDCCCDGDAGGSTHCATAKAHFPSCCDVRSAAETPAADSSSPPQPASPFAPGLHGHIASVSMLAGAAAASPGGLAFPCSHVPIYRTHRSLLI